MKTHWQAIWTLTLLIRWDLRLWELHRRGIEWYFVCFFGCDHSSHPGVVALEQLEMNQILRQQLLLVSSLLTAEQQESYRSGCSAMGIGAEPPLPSVK